MLRPVGLLYISDLWLQDDERNRPRYVRGEPGFDRYGVRPSRRGRGTIREDRMKAPERLETVRLALRRPRPDDAEDIFTRYASDHEVTRYLAWPRHESVAQTRTFLEFSDAEWERWPAGPYLIESPAEGRLLGSTGLAFETLQTASTGYVLARDAWDKGFATEALHAIVDVARGLRLLRLYAICHVDHRPSAHVLEKCGFAREAMLPQQFEFPNLAPGELRDVFRYAIAFGPATGSRAAHAGTD